MILSHPDFVKAATPAASMTGCVLVRKRKTPLWFLG
jgi:hypothetical protein